METLLYFVLAAILVAVGVVGTVLPALPGVLLVFGGLFLAAWAEQFTRVGLVGLLAIGALAALALLLDFVASLVGAKRAGASPQALVGATIGALVGLVFGIVGLILGPFAGAVAGEYLARRKMDQAARVGLGTWLGMLFAAVTKVVIAFLMIATFFAFYFLSAPK